MSFVAISKVKYPYSMQDRIHDVGLKMLPIAQKQPGFISIKFHQSCDTNETMMYWEWQSQMDHEACMISRDWVALMEQSQSIFETNGTEFSIETYLTL